MNTKDSGWKKYRNSLISNREAGFSMDTSRIETEKEYLQAMEPSMQKAFDHMHALEAGKIANPDENRMVGHYWLRNTAKAPTEGIKEQIEEALANVIRFSNRVHSGDIRSSTGKKFSYVLLIGIGGSALGPQFVHHALGSMANKVDIYFLDNTDPDGMERVLRSIPNLSETLCIVISKSGGTKETRNGYRVAQEAWKSEGLDFSSAAVAVTGEGSDLDNIAQKENWIERFPMWDWVGGRTSELSAVGLLPAALQGININQLLLGASDMDELTRSRNTLENPAAMLALSWLHATSRQNKQTMVVLPYKDRLELFSRYLQQLVMESLGKEKDLDGKVVNEGLNVFGNKGSTDQHAYVQQLRDGFNNFFVIFIEVLKDQFTGALSARESEKFNASSLEVETAITSGDFLSGFYQGTKKALWQNGRESLTITMNEVNEHSIGMLIALFERAVGLYAFLINVNAYNQPGVEAGKKAATSIIELQHDVLKFLESKKSGTSEEIALAIKKPESTEEVFHILRRLAANDRIKCEAGSTVFDDRFSL